MSTIINSISYRKGRRVGDVPIDDISEVLKEPDTFVWLGLHEPDMELLRKIQEEFNLHELAIEDACKAHQRAKLEEYGDSLFIVLKTAQLQERMVMVGETHLFVGKKFFISIRHGASSPYTGIREHCEKNPRLLEKGPAFALHALLDFAVDHYRPIVSQFGQELEELESTLFKGKFDKHIMARMYELKRHLLRLRNIMLPMDEICGQLMRFHEDFIPKELRAYFRDVRDHVAREVSVVDSLREMLSAAMQVYLALVAVRQNEVVKSLAGWGAILAIPTVVFSLYGMNFEFMPELKWRFAYPATLSVTVISCIFLHRRLKKSGWV